MSQLDLAVVADVSSRHISFLETGRSAPSAEMILRLGEALHVPLRHVDEMLQAAGHEPFYEEPGLGTAMPPEVTHALELMKSHQEPYPLVVINRRYDILDLNAGALALFTAMLADPELLAEGPLNLVRVTFDPRGAKGALVNFEEVGRALLWRLQREVLAHPEDDALRALLEEALAMPTVSSDWREADLSVPSSPALVVHTRVGAKDLRFLTMVTVFQAPQSVMLDELLIETWFPHDPATTEACRALLAGDVA